MGNIGNGVINTFVDGDVVSASGTAPALFRSALNPKMQIIQQAIDDNDSRINVLEGQITGGNAIFFNVKSAPFNAVGDGIADDTAAIQSAITTAISYGGVVLFPSGTYKITDQLNVPGTVSIKSASSLGIATIRQTTASKNIFNITGNNVVISELILDAYALQSGYNSINALNISNLTIYKCRFVSSSNLAFSGINATNISKSYILYNEFLGTSSTGNSAIYLFSSSTTEVVGNIISGMSSSIWVTRSSGASLVSSPRSKNIIIRDNYVDGDFYSPIVIYSADSCMVVNNFITNLSGSLNTVYGLEVLPSTDNTGANVFSTNLFIQGNIIDNSSATVVLKRGIKLQSVENSQIVDNEIINSWYGLTMYDARSVLIKNNFFNTCNQFAIWMGLVSLTGYDNVSITDNIFLDTFGNSQPYTIFLNSASTSGKRMYVTGNKITRGSKTATYVNYFGIYVQSGHTDLMNFSDNDFSLATSALSLATTNFIMYATEASGDRVFHSATGSYPTSGTFVQGDKVVLPSPVAGGYIGYVCTTAGTPGTWKGYGAIQP